MRSIGRITAAGCAALLIALGGGAAAAEAPAAEGPTGGALGAQWTATEDGPQQYPGVHADRDVPITMSDGVVLKADVYRPADAAGAAVDVRTPVIVTMTPYTKLLSNLADLALSTPQFAGPVLDFARALDLAGTPLAGVGDLVKTVSGGGARTFTVDPQLIRSGYTQVVVDVRGTGFSQGDWQVFQRREQQDTLEVIDWASRQPYSDGTVGMNGVSYSAINQVQAAAKNPPALRAIFPMEPGSDLLRDVVAPGGGVGVGFLPLWLAAIDGLKLMPDLNALFHGDFDEQWLADRAADPGTFLDVFAGAVTAPTVDDVHGDLRALLEASSPLRQDLQSHPERIRVPTLVYGGWHDLFANSEPRIYNAIPLPPGEKQLIMGDGYHLTFGSGFGEDGAPPRLDVLQRAWFDHWLKGIDNGIDTYGPVTMLRQGQGWVTGGAFPAPGMEYRRLYLSAAPSGTAPGSVHDGTLTPGGTGAPATLTVAPALTTLCSRDAAEQTIGIVAAVEACGRDSRIAEGAALSFTSAPVEEPTVLSGPVNVHLNTVMDAADGYWTATLNDVAPDGTSTVLTSGQLVASLRAVDEDQSGYSPAGDLVDPHHTLSLDALEPTVPGRPTTLDVGLVPTDAALAPGHRLRVDVYASNVPKGMPPRPLLNASGLKPEHLVLDPAAPSYVTVPTDRAVG